MHARSRTLLVALTLALARAGASAQSPEPATLEAVAEAIARGRPGEARALLERLPPLLTETAAERRRALLAAAAARPSERARRLLAVAGSEAGHREGLIALVAALGPTVEGLDLIPVEELQDDEPSPRAELCSAAQGLVRAWATRAPDDPLVRLAANLLAAAQTGDLDWPLARIGSETALPVPKPLAEPLRLRWFSAQPAGLGDLHPWQLRLQRESPAAEHEIGSEGGGELLPPPPGAYVLEIESLATGYRRLRRLLVSDLDIQAVAGPKHVALLATLRGAPAAGVAITASTGPTTGAPGFAARTDGQGFALLDLGALGREAWVQLAGVLEEGAWRHYAQCSIRLPEPRSLGPTVQAHLCVDRPLYRPGETCQGRVVLRLHELPEAEPALRTVPFASRPIRIRVEIPGQAATEQTATTDGGGTAAFEIPIPESAGLGQLAISVLTHRDPEDPGEPAGWTTSPREVLRETPARIAEFVPPPLFLELEGPAEWAPGSEAPRFWVRASHPTGAPAAGLEGSLQASAGSLQLETGFTTDGQGQAEIRLDPAGLSGLVGPDRVHLAATMAAPDGQRITARASLALQRDSGPPAAADSERRLRISVKDPDRVRSGGELVEFDIEGPKEVPLLLVIMHQDLVLSRPVVPDAAGRARVAVELQEAWAPGIRASIHPHSPLAWRGSRSSRRATEVELRIAPRSDRLELALAPSPAACAPGQEVALRIRLQDATGAPSAGMATVAVVDETLFSLSADRTRPPASRLAPPVTATRPEWSRSLAQDPPWRILGRALSGGRVPEPDAEETRYGGLGAGGFGGAGGGGGRSAEGPLRQDFRSTAAWFPRVPIGPDGEALVRFRIPDALTRWRVTVVATGPGAGGVLARTEVRTALPLSISLERPRFLREGDVAELVLRADRDGPPDDSGCEIRARASGAGEAPDLHESADFAGANSILRAWPVQAGAAGVASFELGVQGTPGTDRLRIEIPVRPRTVREEILSVALLAGDTRFRVPPEIPGRVVERRLAIPGSVESALTEASLWLEHHPHGCAEQISSRLVPLLAAALARRAAPGGGPDPDPLPDPAQARRLQEGLLQLRKLQQPDGGFAWWRGGPTDLAVTGLVLRTLALAREAGIQPGALGIRLDPGLEVIRGTWSAMQSPEAPKMGARELRARREILAAALLLWPEEDELRQACTQAAREALPSGLAARLGFALARAGESGLAEELMQEIERRRLDPDSKAHRESFSESPASVLAGLLDLGNALEIGPARRAPWLSSLLARSRHGRYDHSFGTAAAVLALSRDWMLHPVQEPGPHLELEIVEAGSQPLAWPVGPAGRRPFELQPTRAEVVVRAEGATGILGTHLVVLEEDAVAAGASSAPIQVERRIEHVRPRVAGEPERTPVSGALELGALHELVVELEAPPELSYLLLEVPLPAGFEVPGAPPGWELREHVVTRGIDRLPPDGRLTLRVPVIPAFAGDFGWPPARAEAMYEPELRGRSAGGRVPVGPRAPKPRAAPATLFEPAGIQAAFTELIQAAAEMPSTPSSRLALGRLRDWPAEAAGDWLVGGFFDLTRDGILRDRELGEAWWSAMQGRTRIVEPSVLGGILARLARPDAAAGFGWFLAPRNLAAACREQLRKGGGSPAEKHALAVAILGSRDHGSGLPPLERPSFVLRTLLGVGDPEVHPAARRERLAALDALARDEATMPPVYALRSGGCESLGIVIREALQAGFSPEENVGVERPEAQRAVSEILDLLHGLRTAIEEAGGFADPGSTIGFLKLLATEISWPPWGSAEPQAHRKLREDLEAIRAGVVALTRPSWIPWISRVDPEAAAALAMQIAASLAPEEARSWAQAELGRLRDRGLPLEHPAMELARCIQSRVPGNARRGLLFAMLPCILEASGPGCARWLDELLPEHLATIPAGVLATRLPAVDAICRELRRRPLEVQVAALRAQTPDREFATRQRVLRSLDPGVLDRLAPQELPGLCELLDPQDAGDRARRERVLARLATELSGPDLARVVAQPGPPRTRGLALEALLRAGVREVAFQAGDPFRRDYEQRLRAASGEAAALLALRAELAGTTRRSGPPGAPEPMAGEDRPPAELAFELWQVLKPHGCLEDLLLLPPWILDADGPEVGRVLDREGPSPIRAAWARQEPPAALAGVLRHASAALAEALAPDLVQAIRARNPGARELATRLQPGPALAELARVLQSEAPETAFLLLEPGALHEAAREFLATLLLEHADPRIRERAARSLFAITGRPIVWRTEDGASASVEPAGPVEAWSAARRRLRREGVSAPNDVAPAQAQALDELRAMLGIGG
jgi:hypothetical protein